MLIEANGTLSGPRRPAPAAVVGHQAEAKVWLMCRAGTVLCALPLEDVAEVMRALAVENLVGAPAFVRGLSIIRGLPVPVADLGLIVCGERTRGALLVTIREGARTIALAVDQIVGISAIKAEVFDSLPPLLRDAAADTVAAMTTLDGELVVRLRAARLVPEHVLARLDAEKTER